MQAHQPFKPPRQIPPKKAKYVVNQDRMSFDEIIEFEEMTGIALGQMNDPATPQGHALRALAFLSVRKVEPDVTIEEVGKMDPTLFEFVTGGEDDIDPTTASS